MRGKSADDRGQAYTLEGVFAAIVILTALVYGLEVVDPGPWTTVESGSTDTIESRAQDVLDIAADEGELSRIARCFKRGKSSFGGDRDGTRPPDETLAFDRMINQSFDSQSLRYIIYIEYWTRGGERERQIASEKPEGTSDVSAPSDRAVSVSRTVTLYDSQRIRENPTGSGVPCSAEGQRLESTSNFYASDIAPNSEIYNVVEVRMVVW